jgi:hypothetical protein
MLQNMDRNSTYNTNLLKFWNNEVPYVDPAYCEANKVLYRFYGNLIRNQLAGVVAMLSIWL